MKRTACALMVLAVGCGRDRTGAADVTGRDTAVGDIGDAVGDGAHDADGASAMDGTVAIDDAAEVALDAVADSAIDLADAAPVVDAVDDAAIDADDSAVKSDADVDDVAAADGTAHDGADADVSPGPTDLAACETTTTDLVPLGEASGVAMLDDAGQRLLVVADSGNAGSALVLDATEGRSIAVKLPLGEGAGDDLEGLERAPDGRIFGLTSSGYLRAWRETQPATFELVLGPIAVTDDAAYTCDPFGVNCGANFEGLCLHPAPPAGECAGWAASKALGQLVCLRVDGAGYELDPTVRVDVTEPDRLSGCAYEPTAPYRVIVAGNLYSGSTLWVVDRAVVRALTVTGTGNQEAIVWLPGHRLQSFGDGQELLGDQSPRAVIECR